MSEKDLTQLWYDKELPRVRKENFRGNELEVSKFSFFNGYRECLKAISENPNLVKGL